MAKLSTDLGKNLEFKTSFKIILKNEYEYLCTFAMNLYNFKLRSKNNIEIYFTQNKGFK